MKLLLAKFGLSLGSLLACGLALEVALRLFHPVSLDWRLVASHPFRIETLAPNFNGYFKDVRVRTNEFGHRVSVERPKRYTRAKPPGVKRVLVFGDSFVFGDGWPAEDSFVEQLQQRLDPTSSRIQVLNLGVPGYGPLQEANYVTESALEFEPDAVIVQFAESNDLIPFAAGHSAVRHASARLKRWLRRNVYLYGGLSDLWYNGRDSRIGRMVWAAVGRPAETPRSAPEPDARFAVRLRAEAAAYYRDRQRTIERDDEGWRQIRESYGRIARFLGERGIPLLVVTTPATWEVECRRWRCAGTRIRFAEPLSEGRRFHELLGQFFRSVTPYYIATEAVLAPYTLEEMFEGRGHYGPKKNALLAEQLESTLRAVGIARRESGQTL